MALSKVYSVDMQVYADVITPDPWSFEHKTNRFQGTVEYYSTLPCFKWFWSQVSVFIVIREMYSSIPA